MAAFFSTFAVFWFLQEFWQIWVMVPVMGFCQLSLFAGYAIYFPELFPTRLRSTGTSFCYNVGRFVAAIGPSFLGLLRSGVFAKYGEPLDMRYAGITMCTVFLLGLVASAVSAGDQGTAAAGMRRRSTRSLGCRSLE